MANVTRKKYGLMRARDVFEKSEKQDVALKSKEVFQMKSSSSIRHFVGPLYAIFLITSYNK